MSAQPQHLDRGLELRVLELWSEILATDVETLDRDGFVVVPDPRDFARDRRATIRTARGTFVLAAPGDLDAAGADPAGFAADVASRPRGAGFIHYLRAAPSGEPDPRVAPLDAEHRPLLDELHERAGADDTEEAEVDVENPAVGIVEGDRLLAIASLLDEGANAVDVGVLVDPTERRRGLAVAVVTELARRASASGQLVQYRCDVENTGSARVARACGFVLWGVLTVSARNAPP